MIFIAVGRQGLKPAFGRPRITEQATCIIKRSCSGSLRLFPLLLVFSALSLHAQDQAFSPAVQDSAKLDGLLKRYQQLYRENLDKIPATNRKDFLEAYQLRWKYIQEKFDGKEICTDARSQEYLDRLVAEIRQGNPAVAKADFSCYFSRSYIPNASCIGEGIILFNMGLFQKMDDESQVAFILCHEIAHHLLQHSDNSIRKYVNTINSYEVQKELREIKGSAYGKRQQLERLVKGLTFDSRRHSRDHEAQADSMAVELMRHTHFALSGALSALALLDTIDIDSLNMAACLRKIFNAPEYPFRSKWIIHDAGLLGGHIQMDDPHLVDSLKTHPDCQKRILLLSNLMKTWPGPVASAFAVDSTRFMSLKNAFRYETIEYAYLTDQYSESLFLTLGLLQARPDDAYLVTQVGRLLNGLYRAQKSHVLGKKVDLPSPIYSANYNLILQFIQNVHLEDLAAISYYYLKPYAPRMDHYIPFRDAYRDSEQILKN